MSTPVISRRMVYQEELDATFGKEVAASPGGEDLYRCLQCGTCGSTCPLSLYMDHTPRKIIAMTRAGFRKEVLNSNTMWLCASCYSCTVECPKKIKVTDIMYTLKRMAIQQGGHPRTVALPVLATEFSKAVMKTGRSNEGRTVAMVFAKTDKKRLLGNMGLGLRLLWRGRVSMFKESMGGGLHQMQQVLKHVNNKDVS